jgi:hypothetical protein
MLTVERVLRIIPLVLSGRKEMVGVPPLGLRLFLPLLFAPNVGELEFSEVSSGYATRCAGLDQCH